jgi:hypothetical protein
MKEKTHQRDSCTHKLTTISFIILYTNPSLPSDKTRHELDGPDIHDLDSIFITIQKHAIGCYARQSHYNNLSVSNLLADEC